MTRIVTALLLACLLGLALPARAAVKVVSSIAALGSLAREVGGDRVSVEALSKGYQDPHFVEAKPSLMLVLNRADLLLHVGLELEIGWLPVLVQGSRNPRIQAGEPGNLDCSQAIPVLDVPQQKVDRSMGDIHPGGNPHYWLPPESAKALARLIADRLSQLDPEGKTTFQANLKSFEERVAAKEKEWAPLVEKIKGTRVATYHRSWSYVSKWLGLDEVGYVEPKPGITPDPAHLMKLIGKMRKEGAKLLLVESYYNRGTARLVAEKAGATMLTLPTDVGASADIKSWFDLVDDVLKELAGAIK